MATYSSVPPPGTVSQATVNAQLSQADIEAWTLQALASLNVTSSTRGTGVSLTIPLDTEPTASVEASSRRYIKPRRESFQRDSQRHRDLLLRGKEGSRRRQRWENDHLLHVPNVQPPLPSDWEVRPTYPVNNVPYYLAPLWDAGIRHDTEKKATAKKRALRAAAGYQEDNSKAGRIPAELRQKLKKSKGAKSLLQDLEQEVRIFIQEWEAQHALLGTEGTELDSDDDEIVFVGRDFSMSDETRKTLEEQLEREKLVFDAEVADQSASFGRWMVHSIADYYGLSSRSVTVGARREAYVGIKMKTSRRVSGGKLELPRPLYGLI